MSSQVPAVTMNVKTVRSNSGVGANVEGIGTGGIVGEMEGANVVGKCDGSAVAMVVTVESGTVAGAVAGTVGSESGNPCVGDETGVAATVVVVVVVVDVGVLPGLLPSTNRLLLLLLILLLVLSFSLVPSRTAKVTATAIKAEDAKKIKNDMTKSSLSHVGDRCIQWGQHRQQQHSSSLLFLMSLSFSMSSYDSVGEYAVVSRRLCCCFFFLWLFFLFLILFVFF